MSIRLQLKYSEWNCVENTLCFPSKLYHVSLFYLFLNENNSSHSSCIHVPYVRLNLHACRKLKWVMLLGSFSVLIGSQLRVLRVLGLRGQVSSSLFKILFSPHLSNGPKQIDQNLFTCLYRFTIMSQLWNTTTNKLS